MRDWKAQKRPLVSSEWILYRIQLNSELFLLAWMSGLFVTPWSTHQTYTLKAVTVHTERRQKLHPLTLSRRSGGCFRVWRSFCRLFSSAPLPRCPAFPIVFPFVGWAYDSCVEGFFFFFFFFLACVCFMGYGEGRWGGWFPDSWSGAHYPARSLQGRPARHSLRHRWKDVRRTVGVWEREPLRAKVPGRSVGKELR